MALNNLFTALERDGALLVADGEPVREEGWAWRYANVIIVISESCDLMVLYRRTGTKIEPGDLKDLEILGRSAGYRVEVRDSAIAFVGPEHDWGGPDDLWE